MQLPSSNADALASRKTVFITHAAPQDNEFALWLSSKLALAGYKVWVDKRRLRGGDDTWDEIDRILRHEAIKQIVVFSHHVTKPGVKKEMAIGEAMKKKISDPKFMIAVRSDDIPYEDAPPEFIRGNILNAYPNWHDCLEELLETLSQAGVHKEPTASAAALQSIIDAREDGRRFINNSPEALLSNWFPIIPPKRIRYYGFEGIQDQTKAWLDQSTIPLTTVGRLAGTFADFESFEKSSAFPLKMETHYDLDFNDFINGVALGPYVKRKDAARDVPNLLRQHFDFLAKEKGLLPVEFGNGEIGWFFPDNLMPKNQIVFTMADGRKIRRTMSGKFKDLRWHVCLLAKPKTKPFLVYRVHVNVILTQDGRTPLPGDKTHKKRKRLTRSWWNDVWRDRLLAGVHFIVGGNEDSIFQSGNEKFGLSSLPLTFEVPISYEAVDPPMISEEDDDGNIVPSVLLDDREDEIGDDVEDAV